MTFALAGAHDMQSTPAEFVIQDGNDKAPALKELEKKLLRTIIASLSNIIIESDSKNSVASAVIPRGSAEAHNSPIPATNVGRARPNQQEDKIEIKTDMEKLHEFGMNCEGFVNQLRNAMSFFSSVGGSRSIVDRMRELLDAINGLWLIDWMRHHASRSTWEKYKVALKCLEDARYRLWDALTDLKEMRPFTYNATRAWGVFLDKSIGWINVSLRLIDSNGEGELEAEGRNLAAYFINEFPKEFFAHTDAVTSELWEAAKDGVVQMSKNEDNAVQRYLTMTTIATFFSGVTATTLQFSFSLTASPLNKAVNLFWLTSLTFSIASAINSLLGMTWRKSPLPPRPSHVISYEVTPRVISLWLDKAPMVFLIVAALLFVIGLNLFAFSSHQGLFVAVSTTVLILLHVAGLSMVTTVFLLQTKRKMTVSEAITRFEFWIENRLDGLGTRIKNRSSMRSTLKVYYTKLKGSLMSGIACLSSRRRRSMHAGTDAEQVPATIRAAPLDPAMQPLSLSAETSTGLHRCGELDIVELLHYSRNPGDINEDDEMGDGDPFPIDPAPSDTRQADMAHQISYTNELPNTMSSPDHCEPQVLEGAFLRSIPVRNIVETMPGRYVMAGTTSTAEGTPPQERPETPSVHHLGDNSGIDIDDTFTSIDLSATQGDSRGFADDGHEAHSTGEQETGFAPD